MAVFGNGIGIKSCGMFIMGLFHIKISNSYTHIYELVHEDHKAMVTTVINTIDDGSIFYIALAVYFTKDLNQVFVVAWALAFVATVLYLLLIPESPLWLFYNEGPSSKRGIKALNYIAWFNGSKQRVPEDASLDLVSEAIQDYDTDLTKSTTRRLAQTKSRSLRMTARTRDVNKGVGHSLCQLFCHKKHRVNAVAVLLMFVCVHCLDFLGLYNSTELQGNLFVNEMVFGAASSFGCLLGGVLAEMLGEKRGMHVALLGVLSLSFAVKMPNLEPTLFYSFFLGQVFFLGAIVTLIFVIQSKYIDQNYSALSLEIDLSFAYLMTAVTPIIAKMEEPAPVIGFVVFCLIAFFANCLISRTEKQSKL